MEAERAVLWAGLTFLAAGGVLMTVSVRRGREVCRAFAERFPGEYAQAGSPRPGFFDSPRRHAYFQLLLQRRFADLPDPPLVERLEALRRLEMRQLWFLLGGFAALGVAFLWLRGWERTGLG